MPKPRRVVFKFRFWVLCAGLLFVFFIPVFRAQNGQAVAQQAQLEQLRKELYTEATRGDRLRDQIRVSETDSFREREARRNYGYVRPGVIRFVAEEMLTDDAGAFAVYSGGEQDVPEDSPTDYEETLDKDWSNFN